MITDEFLKQCLDLYKMVSQELMSVETFVRHVYHNGVMDGRLQELQNWSESEKNRALRMAEQMRKPVSSGRYVSADPLIERGLQKYQEWIGGCEREDS